MKKHAVYVRHGESASNVIIHKGEKSNIGDSGLTNPQSRFSVNYECDAINAMGSDPPLTDLGHQQAACTAEYLIGVIQEMGYKRVQVLVSPYTRAIQTAAPFLDELHKYPTLNFSSDIVVDMYEYTSPAKDISSELQERGVVHDESWQDFVHRVVQFNTQLKSRMNGTDADTLTVIFGHSMFLSVLLSYQGLQEKSMDIPTIAHELPNCCTSTVGLVTVATLSKWSIYHTSYTGHLGRDLTTGHHTLFGINGIYDNGQS